jgi:hypothetical protein
MVRLSTGCFRLLAFILCFLLAVPFSLAQQSLRIVVVEGSDARNVMQQIAPRPLTVRVEDSAGRPVAGAAVIFTSPQTGASGEFANNARTLEVTTNAGGVASAVNYHPNAIAGAYDIEVRAQFQNQTASARIPQENIAQRKSRGRLLAILLVAGAVAAAVIGSSLKKENAPAPVPVTPDNTPSITLGGGAVGAPSQ